MNLSLSQINGLLRYFFSGNNFGMKRKMDSYFTPTRDPRGVITSNVEEDVDYQDLKEGDFIIARFFPNSQKYLDYESVVQGELIHKDPDNPHNSIIRLNDGEELRLFDHPHISGTYSYSRMNYVINYKNLLKK